MPTPRRLPTLIQLRLVTGLVIGVYVTLHLANHALGLISVDAQESARPWFMAFWHSLPGQLLLYGSLGFHAVLGLYSLVRRRSYRIPRWELGQILLGLSIPYLLLNHIGQHPRHPDPHADRHRLRLRDHQLVGDPFGALPPNRAGAAGLGALRDGSALLAADQAVVPAGRCRC